jgi:hypothetical protein
MARKIFPAVVSDGKLRHDQSLEAFEGQEVYVTLIAKPLSASPSPRTSPVWEVEPPVGMDVEHEICVKARLAGEVVLDALVVEGSSMKPCIILPEDSPDE